eukprot:400335_1
MAENSLPFCTKIPFALRGRDFDQNLMSFSFPFFEMQESLSFSMVCGCMEFTKCQTLIIHEPISFLLMHKIFKTSQQTNGMYVKFYRCHVGKTSYTLVCELIHNNITYASVVLVNVHIDPKTRKPTQNCKKMMNFKHKILQNINDKQMQNIMIERRQNMKQSVDILSNYLKRYDINKTKPIFSLTYELNITDLDFNRHTNQGYYSRATENCLYQYHEGFYNAKYRIKQCSQIFLNEMRITRNKYTKSVVNLILHNKMKHGMEEIIGYIQKDSVKCCAFRVVLTKKNKSKL